MISFTNHKHPILSEDLEILDVPNQFSLNTPESLVNTSWFYTILYFREAVKTNARWPVAQNNNMKNQSTFNINPSSAPDLTHSVFHGCNFFFSSRSDNLNDLSFLATEAYFFLVRQAFEQYVGKYEPKAPSFRVFHLRSVTRVKFT